MSRAKMFTSLATTRIPRRLGRSITSALLPARRALSASVARQNGAQLSHCDDAPSFRQHGNLWRVMATGVQTGNQLTLMDQLVLSGVGGGPCAHTHTQNEGLYVVDGQCTFNVAGEEGIQAGPGTMVWIPRMTQHSFTVDKAGTRLLNWYSPAGFELLLMGIGVPNANAGAPTSQSTIRSSHTESGRDRKTTEPGGRDDMAPPWIVRRLASDYGMQGAPDLPFVDPPTELNRRTRPRPGSAACPSSSRGRAVATTARTDGAGASLADRRIARVGGQDLHGVRYSVLLDGGRGALPPPSSWSGSEDGAGESLRGHHDGWCTVVEVERKVGHVIAPHRLGRSHMALCVLHGQIDLLLDDRVVRLQAGGFVYVPAGIVVASRVVEGEKGAAGQSDARLLHLYYPHVDAQPPLGRGGAGQDGGMGGQM